MPQLRRDARRRVVRQFRQLVERQPRRALPCAQHHVANHLPLFSCRSQTFLFTLPPPHRLCLLSRPSCLQVRKLVVVLAPILFRVIDRQFVVRIWPPSRPVGVFVVPCASAASAPSQRGGKWFAKASRQRAPPAVRRWADRAAKVFHRFPHVVMHKYS